MVHALVTLKCKNGHSLPIGFDNNECGCHHEGKPCIILHCQECFKKVMEKGEGSGDIIQIPLDKDGMIEINKLKEANKDESK